MSKIPEGYTSLTPYIVFTDAAAAIELYKKAFDAKVITSMPTEDGNINHAELQIGTAKFMIGSPCPTTKDGKPQATEPTGDSPISFYVYVEDVDVAFKKAKDAGMSEKIPLEDMFWGDRMGSLTDRFNIQWTLAEHVRDVSSEEMAEASKKMSSNK